MLRHGQTEWSKSGQHTGRSDIPLTDEGRRSARELAGRLAGLEFGWTACSPLARSRETAQLAGLTPDEYLDDLLEWDYGDYEGRTTAEIREQLDDPDWVIWDAYIPAGLTPGETPEDVGVRCQRVIERCLPVLDRGQDVALIAHGHLLRMFTATWLHLEPRTGRLFGLDTGTVSALGFERTQRVIEVWNAPSL